MAQARQTTMRATCGECSYCTSGRENAGEALEDLRAGRFTGAAVLAP
jgi:Zn-dependent alcohol dehydrogenase